MARVRVWQGWEDVSNIFYDVLLIITWNAKEDNNKIKMENEKILNYFWEKKEKKNENNGNIPK